MMSPICSVAGKGSLFSTQVCDKGAKVEPGKPEVIFIKVLFLLSHALWVNGDGLSVGKEKEKKIAGPNPMFPPPLLYYPIPYIGV